MSCVLDELLKVISTLEGQFNFEDIVMSIKDQISLAIVNFRAKSENIASAASLLNYYRFLLCSLNCSCLNSDVGCITLRYTRAIHYTFDWCWFVTLAYRAIRFFRYIISQFGTFRFPTSARFLLCADVDITKNETVRRSCGTTPRVSVGYLNSRPSNRWQVLVK